MVDLSRENTKELLGKQVVVTTKLNGAKYVGVFFHFDRERFCLVGCVPFTKDGYMRTSFNLKSHRKFLFRNTETIVLDENQLQAERYPLHG